MVIVHVVAPGRYGGLERVVQLLAKGQRARGHRVSVASIFADPPNGHPFLDSLRDGGVHIEPVLVGARAYGAERAAMTRLCDRLRPDIVHTHGYRPDVVDGSVARRLGVPVVTTIHGFTGGGWKNRLYELLQRRAVRRFDAVVAVCQKLAEALARDGVPGDRIHCVPNAWVAAAPALTRETARRALGLPLDGLRIGWVGRVSREKGLDVLLSALPLVSDPPARVSVLGRGREVAACRRQAEAVGVADRVTWHGDVADADRLFAAFDVFVLSSRTEGTPIALFEAMGSGVPVVATSVGGVPEVVSPSEAMLVRPDDPAALAAAIRDVLRDPGRAAVRAAAAGTRLTRDFAIAPWLTRYEVLYRDLVRRVGTR